MKISVLRIGMVLAVCAVAAGCDTLSSIGDLFDTTTRKSQLKGERISVMSLDQSLQPDPALKDTPVVLPPPFKNDAWAQPGGYPSNALYHLEASGPLQQIWVQDAGKGSDNDSRLTAPPVVAGGMIFVLDAKARVFSFDARNGTPRWHDDLAPPSGSSLMHTISLGMIGTDSSIDPSKGFGGGIAFDGGRVFVSTGFGDVFALDAASGRRAWKVNLGVPIVNAPVASAGRVFVSTQDNHFFALAQKDGRKLWDHTGISTSAGILESTSAAVAGEYVIAPYTSGEIYALRIQNGRPAWNDMLTSSGAVTALSELDDIAGRPVVDRGIVYAISHSGVMAAINMSTGDRTWTRDIGGIQTPWAAGDFVYVLDSDQQVLCLTRADGRVKWMHQLPRYQDLKNKEDPIVWAGPVLVSDRLIVVSSAGYAESISPYTGRLIGRVEIPDAAYIAPVVADDTLYLLTNDAQLVALR
ncbi:MAG: PQQ-binding-like beta-propeller repeat protein [Alphaproteobacteria bacterium]|nr:PQQ-binding-like beta-propeller repeat protein [Alphaproteobacteria bacterium]MBV9693675.1 PQQ-binding-like beta-propeller repeat protein [Alphaproteobacteria bacterium]